MKCTAEEVLMLASKWREELSDVCVAITSENLDTTAFVCEIIGKVTKVSRSEGDQSLLIRFGPDSVIVIILEQWRLFFTSGKVGMENSITLLRDGVRIVLFTGTPLHKR